MKLHQFLLTLFILMSLVGCANFGKPKLLEREKIFGTDGEALSIFHRVAEKDGGLSLKFPGYLVGIEKAYKKNIEWRKELEKLNDDKLRGNEKYRKNVQKILNGNKKTFVSHIVEYRLDTHKGYIKEDFFYNAYERCLEPEKAYLKGLESLDELKNRLFSDETRYTHIILYCMGWNTDQQESLRNYNSLLSYLIKEYKDSIPFRPLVIGISWPSEWRSKFMGGFISAISYPVKADDADEVGILWVNKLLWDILVPLKKEKNYTPDFFVSEFKHPQSVEALCTAIGRDGFNISLNVPLNTVEWLNALLEIPDLYSIVKAKRPDITFSKDVKNQAHKTRSYRSRNFSSLSHDEQYMIKRLNRLVLEETYRNETPKMPRYVPIILIGHSFGARVVTRAVFSNGLIERPGMKNELMKMQPSGIFDIDLVIGLQGAFSINRFIPGNGKEGSPYSDFKGGNYAKKFIFTWSKHDFANPVARFFTGASHVGGYYGYKESLKYPGEFDHFRIAAENGCCNRNTGSLNRQNHACGVACKCLPLCYNAQASSKKGQGQCKEVCKCPSSCCSYDVDFEKVENEKETQGMKWENSFLIPEKISIIDASALIENKPYGKGGNAHSDIYTPGVATFVWDCIRNIEK